MADLCSITLSFLAGVLWVAILFQTLACTFTTVHCINHVPCPATKCPAAAAAASVDVEAAEEAAAARTAAAERAAAAAAGPTRVVSITRPPAMEEARRQLPIIGLEQEIMEGIAHNDVVVSCVADQLLRSLKLLRSSC